MTILDCACKESFSGCNRAWWSHETLKKYRLSSVLSQTSLGTTSAYWSWRLLVQFPPGNHRDLSTVEESCVNSSLETCQQSCPHINAGNLVSFLSKILFVCLHLHHLLSITCSWQCCLPHHVVYGFKGRKQLSLWQGRQHWSPPIVRCPLNGPWRKMTSLSHSKGCIGMHWWNNSAASFSVNFQRLS